MEKDSWENNLLCSKIKGAWFVCESGDWERLWLITQSICASKMIFEDAQRFCMDWHSSS